MIEKTLKQITFRSMVRPDDIEIARNILISSGFFYEIEIPVALELVQDGLENGTHSDYHFLFAEVEGRTVSYSCFGHIAGTEGSFDLYWIVTHNDFRGQGIGKILLEETHRVIREMGGRILIAETSTLEKYAPTRHFYLSSGYLKEAQIDDFYKIGDGKVSFVKRFLV
ncbi:MAG: GNAT family N-acetyltransferase [Bacteroidetes bacterium]|nr:GNAT family N-acetyltransferase [Bacteroidota bacterium]